MLRPDIIRQPEPRKPNLHPYAPNANITLHAIPSPSGKHWRGSAVHTNPDTGAETYLVSLLGDSEPRVLAMLREYLEKTHRQAS